MEGGLWKSKMDWVQLKEQAFVWLCDAALCTRVLINTGNTRLTAEGRRRTVVTSFTAVDVRWSGIGVW
jgi:hypothetical protein